MAKVKKEEYDAVIKQKKEIPPIGWDSLCDYFFFFAVAAIDFGFAGAFTGAAT